MRSNNTKHGVHSVVLPQDLNGLECWLLQRDKYISTELY